MNIRFIFFLAEFELPRPEMEDAVSAIPRFLQSSSNSFSDGRFNPQSTAHFFGVYDGHGGSQVASYCRERMHLALAEEIAMEKPMLCDGDTWQEKWKKALFNSSLRVDSEIESVAPETVGSTSIVAVVFPTHIFVANCGDSRAVLCRGKTPHPLSTDHKTDREDEEARIEAAGGKVIQWNGARVFGVLAMSRSIGMFLIVQLVCPLRSNEALTKCNLNIQVDSKGAVEIEGLTEVEVPNVTKARWWYNKGRRVKSTSWTNVNEASSRSRWYVLDCSSCIYQFSNHLYSVSFHSQNKDMSNSENKSRLAMVSHRGARN